MSEVNDIRLSEPVIVRDYYDAETPLPEDASQRVFLDPHKAKVWTYTKGLVKLDLSQSAPHCRTCRCFYPIGEV